MPFVRVHDIEQINKLAEAQLLWYDCEHWEGIGYDKSVYAYSGETVDLPSNYPDSRWRYYILVEE